MAALPQPQHTQLMPTQLILQQRQGLQAALLAVALLAEQGQEMARRTCSLGLLNMSWKAVC